MLDTHERMGEEEEERGRANPDGAKVGWGRVIGVNDEQHADARAIDRV